MLDENILDQKMQKSVLIFLITDSSCPATFFIQALLFKLIDFKAHECITSPRPMPHCAT
jgi:hypothetical protein